MTNLALQDVGDSGLDTALSPKQIIWRANVYRVRGWKSKSVEQSAMHMDMAMSMREVELTTFPVGGAKQLEDADLDPGKEFRNYTATLARFEKQEPPRAKVEVDVMRQAAQAYLDHYDTHSKRQKAQSKTQQKHDACQQTLLDLARYDQLDALRGLGAPPWDAKTSIKAATLKATLDFEGLPAGSQAEQLDAGNANTAFWFTKDQGGDEPAKTFLFKPDTGKQADIDGFPDGAETMREAMAGRTADLLGGMTGIRFEVPETQVITVDAARFPDGSIDRPRNQQGQPVTGSLQQFADSDGEMRKNDLARMAKIPPEDCQKVAILDIVTMNMDRHAGNLMLKSGGQPGIVPIDHGLTFPPTAAVGEMATRIGDVQNAVLAIPGAHEPFSPEMLKAIEKLDPDVIVAGLKNELKTLDDVHGGASAKVPGDALEISRRSTAFLKMAAPLLSPAAVQVALGQNAHKLFDPNLDMSDPSAFEDLAETIIAKAQEQQEDWKTYFTMPKAQQQDLAVRLFELGWPSDRGVIKQPWMIANMKFAMGLYASNTLNVGALDDLKDRFGDQPVTDALKDHPLGALMAGRVAFPVPPPDPNAPPLGDIAAEVLAIDQAFPREDVNRPAFQEKLVRQWRRLQAVGGMPALNAAIETLGLNGASEADARNGILAAIATIIAAEAQADMADEEFAPDAIDTKLKTRMLEYISELALMLPTRRRNSIMKVVARYRKAMGTRKEPSRKTLDGVQTATLDRVRKDLTADLKELRQQAPDQMAARGGLIKGWETDIASGAVSSVKQQLGDVRLQLNIPRA